MSSLLQPLLPLPTDGLTTPTSDEQSHTESVIRELLALYLPAPGRPASSAALRVDELFLDRNAHIRWLMLLLNPLPAPYTSLDASRPWLIYWVTHSLALMNAQLDDTLKRRAVDTLKSFWNAKEGGFGGGPGQMAHLAPTYAAVSALCYLGGPEDAWAWIDRQAIHDWMVSLKQPDGSFVMHAGGEVDVRGCYCALTTAVLLNILTPDLALNTSNFIASCQTYEGGLASASQPQPSSSSSFSAKPPPLGEAHGGYTFCALASYFALQASPSLHSSSSSSSATNPAPSATLNAPALLRWASTMQASPIEAGGFRGRTNKLVDGCYSWWCGGLFSMIDALLPVPAHTPHKATDLYNRVALQEYVLIAAQAQQGGLRDKPGKGVDAYHSCYNLSGLASAQHYQAYNAPSLRSALERDWLDVDELEGFEGVLGKEEGKQEAGRRMKDTFCAALAWHTVEERKIVVGREENETVVNHPVYNVTVDALERMMRWSYGQPPKVGIEELQ